MIKINDKISYIEANIDPLSADIGVIKADSGQWLFDVGNGIENICELNASYNVVISHFHLDHIGNLNDIKINKLYVSKETARHLKKYLKHEVETIIVDQEIETDGLKIIPIVSSHSKGSLCLKVDDYIFVGDALYAKTKGGELSYNVQMLKTLIDKLKILDVDKLLVSHYKTLIRDKKEVINELESYYGLREKNNPEIKIKTIKS